MPSRAKQGTTWVGGEARTEGSQHRCASCLAPFMCDMQLGGSRLAARKTPYRGPPCQRLFSLPVSGRGGKYGRAARQLRRAVQRVRCRLPSGEVRRRPMRFQRRLVPVDLVKVVDILVLNVLKDVEAHAARLVPLGAEGIGLDRLEETLAPVKLYADLHPDRQHCRLHSLGTVGFRRAPYADSEADVTRKSARAQLRQTARQAIGGCWTAGHNPRGGCAAFCSCNRTQKTRYREANRINQSA